MLQAESEATSEVQWNDFVVTPVPYLIYHWYEGVFTERTWDMGPSNDKRKWHPESVNERQFSIFVNDELPKLKERIQENAKLSAAVFTPSSEQARWLLSAIRESLSGVVPEVDIVLCSLVQGEAQRAKVENPQDKAENKSNKTESESIKLGYFISINARGRQLSSYQEKDSSEEEPGTIFPGFNIVYYLPVDEEGRKNNLSYWQAAATRNPWEDGVFTKLVLEHTNYPETNPQRKGTKSFEHEYEVGELHIIASIELLSCRIQEREADYPWEADEEPLSTNDNENEYFISRLIEDYEANYPYAITIKEAGRPTIFGDVLSARDSKVYSHERSAYERIVGNTLWTILNKRNSSDTSTQTDCDDIDFQGLTLYKEVSPSNLVLPDGSSLTDATAERIGGLKGIGVWRRKFDFLIAKGNTVVLAVEVDGNHHRMGYDGYNAYKYSDERFIADMERDRMIVEICDGCVMCLEGDSSRHIGEHRHYIEDARQAYIKEHESDEHPVCDKIAEPESSFDFYLKSYEDVATNTAWGLPVLRIPTDGSTSFENLGLIGTGASSQEVITIEKYLEVCLCKALSDDLDHITLQDHKAEGDKIPELCTYSWCDISSKAISMPKFINEVLANDAEAQEVLKEYEQAHDGEKLTPHLFTLALEKCGLIERGVPSLAVAPSRAYKHWVPTKRGHNEFHFRTKLEYAVESKYSKTTNVITKTEKYYWGIRFAADARKALKQHLREILIDGELTELPIICTIDNQ